MGKEEIAVKIRQARKKAGLTQAGAAASVGINTQTISDYERGRTRIPSETLQRLCLLYGISPGEFLGGASGDELRELGELILKSPGMKKLVILMRNAPEEEISRATVIMEALLKHSHKRAD